MKNTLISKENGNYKFEIAFSNEEFEEAINKAYKANRNKFAIDGFRKGKAPRKIIESYYGADVFYSDALNELFDKGYFDALNELDIEAIAQPVTELKDLVKGEDVVVTVTVAGFPEIDVEKYKGLEIDNIVTKIGAKEVKEELEKVQKSQGRMETVTDRKSKLGDTVVIDFVGSVGGEEFQGGTADNFELKLGSGQFIPGFEEQLVDKAAEDEVDVQVTFPEEYHVEELAGKEALFKTKIHEIKEEILPEIDDELASDVSEFETLADYKKDLKKQLQKKADERDESIMKDRALEALFNANKIEPPISMIESEIDNMVYEMNQQLSYQGLKLDDYLKWMGKEIKDFREEMREDAVKRVVTRILLKNIARIEKLEASEEEVNEMLAEFAAQYGQPIEQVKEMVGASGLKYFAEDVQTKKAIDLIYKKAVKGEPIETITDKNEE